MKNIKYTIFGSLLLLGVLTSCTEDDLDLKPISGTYEEEFYKTDNDVYGLVLGIYDGLQAVPQREFTLLEMRSDNATSALHEGEYQQLETFNVDPTNSVSTGYYAANYNVIYRANQVLDKVGIVVSTTNKALFIAEAKFARALSYFNLVRAYGEVPVVDRLVTANDTEYFAKKAVGTIYTFIEKDLTEAIAMGLPLKSSATVPVFGRATKQAAQGILAKVYLTQGKYVEAKAILATLVTDSKYLLQTGATGYSNVFRVEGNDEILFAIPYTNDSQFESQTFSIEMTNAGGASGLNYITNNFRTFMLASTGDYRTAINMLGSANILTNKWTRNSSAAALAGNDWIVLRLSDVYLMYVESILAGGTTTSDAAAITYFDRVRNRSFATAITSTSVTSTMLLNERRKEFAYENQRLYDLIRFGVANTVLGAYSATFTPTKDLLLPLPQSQINTSKGLLIQNPLLSSFK